MKSFSGKSGKVFSDGKKRKYSNKAISREAARKRRRVESDMFGDLSRLLPLPPSVRVHLDKPSIIRLTLSYIRAHARVLDRGTKGTEGVETNMLLTILEGFLIVLSTKGDIIFLSDDVSKYLGMTQTELMGYNIFEFTHPCDHEEIRNNLHLTEVWCGAKRDFVMRIKSTLTHRGRSANLKSATWKVLHLQGRAKACFGPSSASCLLLTCMPLPLSHTLLSTHTFTSQHSMDMRFTYCDQRATVFLGYTPVELQGRSIYELCHTLDTDCLTKNHLNLCFKSQSVSGRYRMLVRGGGYVWVESHSAVIPSVRPSRSRPGAHQFFFARARPPPAALHPLRDLRPQVCFQQPIRYQKKKVLVLSHTIQRHALTENSLKMRKDSMVEHFLLLGNPRVHLCLAAVWRSRPCSSLWTRPSTDTGSVTIHHLPPSVHFFTS
uniref:Endothelial PAS domain protein 1b n=1 Tax=Mola mola TaxID=94237 RepID=A0A3Q3WYY4_MOLML